MLELTVVVMASVVGTYAWRALGVLLSGRIRVNSELFKWVTCVAYAMVAGLISRIIFIPSGMLVQTMLVDRLGACVLALLAYHLSQRNLLVAVSVGVAAIMAISVIRSG